jgi:hypothetical protein
MGLYRGSAMPFLSHLIKRPIQYPISEYLKQKTNDTQHKTFYNYAIGASTGIIGPIFGTPLQVVKVSVQSSTSKNQIKNSFSYIKDNYMRNGIRGFYRGFIPTAIKDSVFGMSFIGNYYTFRDYLGTDKWYKNFISGASAHCVTWYVFIPIDYVKTTIQKSETKITILDVVKNTYKSQGIFAFWKGVVPACARTIPVSGIAMTGYEYTRMLLLPDLDEKK